MNLLPTKIAGVMVAETTRVADHRGAFARFFCEDELAPVLGNRHIVQVNHSRTSQPGAVRGMHFQHAPHAETKMVRCIKGRVWDVAVDLRRNSPTFLQWHAVELSAENDLMMVIPEGCAHGFQVLEAESELLYLHTACYTPTCEGGVCYDDPLIDIHWPLAVTDISDRDQLHPLLDEHYSGVKL
ncbi:MAG: dTDP-4-dehydrorhamnose 3,5-epimerase [Zetaproteobacteria bacterium CG12_big_fil_rev_8_21_14_0_65_54_13]|nr:MAG: dTDP-4-dehydrorhamnose 3,5-epimerase [Zetaproteobacteria bacterium CG23_combo_of_CG06-09_8_20_14_all_54_7]PIW44366.1 MAG: dTDP-4-dehydrorhamnose 3,5-epimerase [Zetaproteobacteria bacterium CG12_big_fil_rev_8_21_14_0_65_54_13]PIX55093.1 MAG: dTDP-4-dehydrorhamnose 3,5-epimerase [Zetaproteobacteria bacterium CG_4_10_14_3_um_filter_54_28]PJA30189.1 MAG: dTDP-4-dehydrorhamnose 3,5-epimerase [Zetaproteobacteria bacterium CG_4_9_14_3_um_filter_54_145]